MRLSVHVHYPPYKCSRPGWHAASTCVLKLSKGGRPKHAQCFPMPQANCQCCPGSQVEAIWGSTAQSTSWCTTLSLPGTWSVCSELRLAGPIACQCLLVFTPAVHSALYLAVCTISSGGFHLQQSSFHACELVLATARWIQKEGEQTSWKELIGAILCVPQQNCCVAHWSTMLLQGYVAAQVPE